MHVVASVTDAGARVRTAHGPKTFNADGGMVLPHEHIVVDVRVWWEGPGNWDDSDQLDEGRMDADQIARLPQAVVRENMILSDWYLAAKELRLAALAGCQLLADLTVQGLDPQRALAVRAADLAGLDVVLGLGRYLDPTMSREERAKSAEQLADEWTRDYEEGFEGLLPGIIGEIGTSETMSPAEEVSLRAAARLQLACGLPINVHVHPYARQALAALSLLDKEGADLSRVAISHCDGDLDQGWLRQILDTGAYVEMDMFGTGPQRLISGRGYPSDEERIEGLAALCEWGFSTRLLLSHDICHRNSLHRYGGWGYDHIARTIAPKLRVRLDERVTTQLTSLNALRFLEWKKPKQ